MDKKHFFIKLIGNRSTCPRDITLEEQIIMKEHSQYWKRYMDEGIMLIYGPVFDPKGTYGMGVLEVNNEEDLNNLLTNDPAIINGLGKYEIFPMKAVAPGK